MRWLACELHTHTYHSDGRQTLGELARGAKRLGFDCIALTDHNTMSGLADKEAAERETGIAVIPGMEWTTFYGHMLALGSKTFVDWRTATPGSIEEGVAEVRANGGISGLAHPYRMGSPYCTGCYWEFEIRDWKAFDFIEVWSTTFASVKNDSRRAFALWTSLLDAGVRIAATSGRDWHEQEETEEPLSVTYLGLADEDGPVPEAALKALKEGRVSVTIGPLVTMEVRSEATGLAYLAGDAVPAPLPGERSRLWVSVNVDFSVRKGIWSLPAQSFRLVVNGSEGPLAESVVEAENETYRFDVEPEGGKNLWARAELWGVAHGARTLIAFTNAVYFD